MSTETAPRTGRIVKYHGSIPQYHGRLFRITSTIVVDGKRRFTLAYRGDPARAAILQFAREESVTVVPANSLVTRKCGECKLEHTYERSELLAGVSCSLALAS